jgi:threonine dehydrogenase-like Zn-dependent dehydrogenase
VLHYREVQVHGSYASRHRDQVRALDMLAADAGGIRSVVSEVIPLEDAPGAFERIRAGEALKLVVAP